MIPERFKFNSRVQKEDESPGEFVTDFKKLAIMYEYNQQQLEIIRDRPVVEFTKASVKEKLFTEPQLTLESAI